MSESLTNQQLFDECAAHVIKQGGRAIEGGSCVYDAGQGDSCAIGGPLLARGLYDRAWDTIGITMSSLTELAEHNVDLSDETVCHAMLTMMVALDVWGVSEDQIPMLQKIQRAHDGRRYTNDDAIDTKGAFFVAAFKRSMQAIAIEFNLNPALVAA